MAEEGNNSLELWHKTLRNSTYASLMKFFRITQTLPTSSSDVEQALEGLMLMHQE